MKSWAIGAAALLPAAALAACGDDLPAEHRHQVQDAGLVLVFAPQPAPWAVGRHFALELRACPLPGQPMPGALKVDADMPAHRHGMNYAPSVQAHGAGRYRAEGLMLHMPGRWRLLFELALEGRTLRLQHELDLP